MIKDYNKVLGALLGVAVGDALGGPLEFMTAEQIRQAHGVVTEMIGGGWLDLAPGEITDDTQMTLCVALGIAENPDDPMPAIGRRFVEWFDGKPKDIGNCCRAVISRAKDVAAHDFSDWAKVARTIHEATNEQTAGNGALMRTIYPALFYDNPAKAEMVAEKIGRMTHWNDDSNAAVINYTRAISDILFKNAGIEQGRGIVRHYTEYAEFLTGKNPPPDGYVLNSYICAANAVLTTDSFEEAIICAVNLGGDADTIGAIAGGLAGALYGAKQIPGRWVLALDAGVVKRIEELAKIAAHK